ncbi:glycosyltransferase family 2 protein [Flaviaesturariibacter aridisoli]|uniref:glycosyltransferase family 2 protein n=1 Tax=Flaviaesturariibacter aridisoli TaxID=2545761 RepID=UPI001404376E|nr:glycosyltransferase [Flaviaesturariibacter aridisoli]
MPLTVSVIIVNYNVRYFLEQCLHSVQAASREVNTEVIVVDNNSTDGSAEYLQERFPGLVYVANTENAGFSRACNQGLARAGGHYILFLNPDTLLAEDSLERCLAFFESHPRAGALGVRMIDGTGSFLKESKRSFPSPLTALYKLFGLSLLFPNSRVFGRYHLGHLSEHANHEVDVLAGAFMFIPRAVLDEVGSFDEAFFMYGEDVDLSYRIQEAGYKNYYLADTTIIHFKGESTKRGSLNYVRLFYSAMNIFVRKHYGGARARMFRVSIQVAIWLRAALAAGAKALRWVGLPVIDGVLILLAFWLAKELWTGLVRPDIVLPGSLIRVSLPAYALVYIGTAYYAGLYDKIYRRANLLRASAIAALVLLAGYALLPENLRFSRAILVGGAVLGFAAIGIVRRLLLGAGLLLRPAEQAEKPYILVAATAEEYAGVQQLLARNGRAAHIIGRVGLQPGEPGTVTDLDGAPEAARALGAQELIFCIGTLRFVDAVAHTGRLARHLRLRYHRAGSGSMVGSDSKDSSGEALSLQTPLRLAEPAHRRSKRLADVLLALVFVATLPLHLLAVRRPGGFVANVLAVLLGRKTWVGYRLPAAAPLPALRPGVLSAGGRRNGPAALPEETLRQADYWYARDYDVTEDLKIVLRNYRWLGL